MHGEVKVNMIKSNRLQILFFVFITSMTATVSSASASGPMDQVKLTVDAILDTLRNNSLAMPAKREKIKDLIYKRFYFRAMAQRTLATNWRKASEEEKKKFTELFSSLLEKTYLGKIEAYTNETVEYSREKLKGTKKAVIDTFVKTTNVDIPITYKTLKKGDEWLVYDVIIEEISLISNYRSSYKTIVRNEGISGLLARMEEKLQEMDKAQNSTAKAE